MFGESRMSYDYSFCSDPKSKLGSKRHFNSGSELKPQDSIPRTFEYKSPLDTILSLFIFVRLLGSGAFGVVNLMEQRISSKLCAVKVVKKTKTNADGKILDEIKLGMKLDSQYICKVNDYHEDDYHIYIIMEYLQGKDLCDFIRENPTFFMKNPKIFWFVIESILRGLVYLHSQGIAHMDVKPENIFLLLDNKGNIIGVKLIDLGLSIVVDDTKMYFRGTCHYMAPEFFNPFWFKGLPSDIWSLGMTAYAMLMASLPISSKKKDPLAKKDEIYRNIEHLLKLKEGSFNPFSRMNKDPNIAEMQEFTCSCLIVNPEKRPTADNLLKMIPATFSQMSS